MALSLNDVLEQNPQGLALNPLTPKKNAAVVGNAPAVTAPLPSSEPSSLARRAIGDPLVSLAKGVVSVPESAVGLADLVSGGQAGKSVQSTGIDFPKAQLALDNLYSLEQQQANQNVQNAQGFVPTLKAMAQNPSTIPNTIIQSVPLMVGGQGIARGAMALAPKLAPIVAGAIGEGAVTAGSNAENVRQQTTDGLLTPAQSALTAASGLLTGAITHGSGKLADQLGVGDVNQMILNRGVNNAIAHPEKSMLRRGVEGGLVEGGQETTQSAQEQAATNLALGKPIGEGVGNAAALGLVTGIGMGAPMGAMQQPARRDYFNPALNRQFDPENNPAHKDLQQRARQQTLALNGLTPPALQWETPAAQIKPDAQKVVDNRTIPATQSLQELVDSRTQNDSPYNPLAGTWDKPTATNYNEPKTIAETNAKIDAMQFQKTRSNRNEVLNQVLGLNLVPKDIVPVYEEALAQHGFNDTKADEYDLDAIDLHLTDKNKPVEPAKPVSVEHQPNEMPVEDLVKEKPQGLQLNPLQDSQPNFESVDNWLNGGASLKGNSLVNAKGKEFKLNKAQFDYAQSKFNQNAGGEDEQTNTPNDLANANYGLSDSQKTDSQTPQTPIEPLDSKTGIDNQATTPLENRLESKAQQTLANGNKQPSISNDGQTANIEPTPVSVRQDANSNEVSPASDVSSDAFKVLKPLLDSKFKQIQEGHASNRKTIDSEIEEYNRMAEFIGQPAINRNELGGLKDARSYGEQPEGNHEDLPIAEGGQKRLINLPKVKGKAAQTVAIDDDYVLSMDNGKFVDLPPMSKQQALEISKTKDVDGEKVNEFYDVVPRAYAEHLGYKPTPDKFGLIQTPSTPQSDLITKKDGNPFASESIAKSQLAVKGLTKTHEITPVDGGFALKPKSDTQKDSGFTPTHIDPVDNTPYQHVSGDEYLDESGDKWNLDSDQVEPIALAKNDIKKKEEKTGDFLPVKNEGVSVPISYDDIQGLIMRPSDKAPFQDATKARQALKNNPSLDNDTHEIVPIKGGYAIAPTSSLSFEQFKSLPDNQKFSDDVNAQTYEALTGNKAVIKDSLTTGNKNLPVDSKMETTETSLSQSVANLAQIPNSSPVESGEVAPQLSKSGKPFATKKMADAVINSSKNYDLHPETHEAVELETGGFGIVPKTLTFEQFKALPKNNYASEDWLREEYNDLTGKTARRIQELKNSDYEAIQQIKSARTDDEVKADNDAAKNAANKKLINPIIDDLSTMSMIDNKHEDARGLERNSFANAAVRKIENLHKAGNVEALNKIFEQIETYNAKNKKPLFTQAAKVWGFKPAQATENKPVEKSPENKQVVDDVSKKGQNLDTLAQPTLKSDDLAKNLANAARGNGIGYTQNKDGTFNLTVDGNHVATVDKQPTSAEGVTEQILRNYKSALDGEGKTMPSNPQDMTRDQFLIANKFGDLIQDFEISGADIQDGTGGLKKNENGTFGIDNDALYDRIQAQKNDNTLKIESTGNKSLPVENKSIGNTISLSTPKEDMRVNARYEVVNDGVVITSHDTNLRVNPQFPQELQPRNRTAKSYETDLQNKVANFNPERVGVSATTDSGAPIVDAKGNVISGNGRAIAINKLPDHKSKEYKQWLLDNADKFGIDKAHIESIDKPVLVRRLTDNDVNLGDLARKSNDSAIKEMSVVEQAFSDADSIDEETFTLYDGGKLTTNKAFLNQFIQATGADNIYDNDGMLSQKGITRIESSIMAKAYGNESIVADLYENSDTEVKSLLNALLKSSANWLKLRAVFAETNTKDLTQHLTAAVMLVKKARMSDGQTVKSLMQQRDLMSNDSVHPMTEKFVKLFFYDDNLSKYIAADKVAEILNNVSSYMAKSLINADVFGENLTPSKILDKVYEQYIKTKQEKPKQTPRGYFGDVFNPIATRGDKIKQAQSRQRNEGQGADKPSVTDEGREGVKKPFIDTTPDSVVSVKVDGGGRINNDAVITQIQKEYGFNEHGNLLLNNDAGRIQISGSGYNYKTKHFDSFLLTTYIRDKRFPQPFLKEDSHQFNFDTANELRKAIDSFIGKSSQDKSSESDKTDKPNVKDEGIDAKQPAIINTTKAHDDFIERVNNGEVTAEKFKAAFDSLLENKEVIKNELNGMTKDKLMSEFRLPAYSYRSEKKDRVVDAAFDRMLDPFTIGKGVSYFVGGDMKNAQANAIKKMVEATTDEQLKKWADTLAESKAERAKAIEAKKEGIENPQTLEDFKNAHRAFATDTKDYKSVMEARKNFTPEQLERYDALAAQESRGKRKSSEERARSAVRTTATTTEGQIIAGTHTKTGEPIFTVKAADRVDKDTYNQWNTTAKRLGGYYSSYRGNGAVQGFIFKTNDNAQAFLDYLGGNAEGAKEAIATRRNAFEDDSTQSAVERLREMSDRMESDADESLNQDRKVNTHRRARQAASAESSANNWKATAKTMRKIAGAIESGKAKLLDSIRARTHVDLLQSLTDRAKWEAIRDGEKGKTWSEIEELRKKPATKDVAEFVKYPAYGAYRSDLAGLARKLLENEGTKKIGKQLFDLADDVSKDYEKFAKENLQKVTAFSKQNSNGTSETARFESKAVAESAIKKFGFKGQAIVLSVKPRDNIIILSPSEAIKRGIWKGDDKYINIPDQLGKDLVEKVGRSKKFDLPWHFDSVHTEQKRLAAMNIETPQELRAAVREFIDLREVPKAPDRVKELERAMVGRQNDGLDFFPTPAPVVQSMLDAADIQEGMRVLEPSAGMGHIADVIREQTDISPDVIELSNKRRELLEAKGYDVVGDDFLEFTADAKYDRIIMNPPFGDRRDAEHLKHAYKMLAPNGRLVAIVGEGVFFGNDAKAKAFREWLENVGGTEEKLSEGSFNDPTMPVTTNANARMVVIDKAARLGAADDVVVDTKELSNSVKSDANKANALRVEPYHQGYTNKPAWMIVHAANNRIVAQGFFNKVDAQDAMKQLNSLGDWDANSDDLRALPFFDEADTLIEKLLKESNKGNENAPIINTDIKLSKQSPLSENENHTRVTLTVRLAKLMADTFGKNWFPRLVSTGKFKVIDSKQAGVIIGDNAKFHKAWHGSPHDFNKFSLDEIGTGEGTQFYGHGLYFSDSKHVAEHYKWSLANSLEEEGEKKPFSVDGVTYSAEKGNYYKHDKSRDLSNKITKELFDSKEKQYLEKTKNGTLFEVELAPKQDEYLEWDKPLNEQSEFVQKVLSSVKERRRKGSEIYNALGDPKSASKRLHAAGIRGVKYLDGASRYNNNGTHNYVIFSDKDITIEAKYSKNGDVIAFYNPANQTTYFVADNLSKNTSDKALKGLMLHELGVHALQLNKGNKEFSAILKQVEQLKNNPKFKEAFKRAEMAGTYNAEEALGYLVENHPELSVSQRALAWFREALRSIANHLTGLDKVKFIQWANKLTPEDLTYMAVNALKKADRNLQSNSPKGGIDDVIRASKEGYEGNNPVEAREWTKSVEQGLDMSHAARMERAKAMGFDIEQKWYHGTSNKAFNEFSRHAQRQYEKRRTSGDESISFSSSPDFASRYAMSVEGKENGTSHVIPVFIKTKNAFDFRNEKHLNEAVEWLMDYWKEHPTDANPRFDADNKLHLLKQLKDGYWGIIEHDLKRKVDGYDFYEYQGFEGAYATEQNTVNFIAYQPENIRSIFAAFNPDEVDSADLMASKSGGIRYSKDKETLLAPNGKRSNLNAMQHAQVRTPEFISWFGDWENDPQNASKVVDENGEPLVVYHGTKSKFTVFNNENLPNGWIGKGLYFTPNKAYAKENGKVVMQVFINAKNPFVIKGDSSPLSEIKSVFHEADEFNIADVVKKHGYDGIRFTHWDAGEMLSVFDSNQIKSATGNTGAFSKDDNDIRHSAQSTLSPNAKPRGITENQANAVLTRFKNEFNGVKGVTFESYATLADAIGEEKAAKLGRVKGFFNPATNTVVIIRNNVDSINDTFSTLRHEVLGHYGLDVLGKKEKAAFLADVIKAKANPFAKSVFEKVKTDYPELAKQPFKQAEEVFARIVEQTPSNLQEFTDRLIAKLGKFLRDIGLLKGVFTKAEMRQFAKTIADNIRNGNTAPNDGHDGRIMFNKEVPEKLSRWSKERMDSLLKKYAYTNDDTRTKAFAAFVSPDDFLAATTTPKILTEIESESTPLDVEKLAKEFQQITLYGELNGNKFEIIDHEGRHRMVALRNSGVKLVPVVFDFGRAKSLEFIDKLSVTGQSLSKGNGKDFSVRFATPINWDYAINGALRDEYQSEDDFDGIKFSKENTPTENGNNDNQQSSNTSTQSNHDSLLKRAQSVIHEKLDSMDTLGNLPSKKDYLAGRYKTLGNLAKVEEIAKSVYDTFRKASKSDAEAIYRYLTTKDATVDEIHNVMLRKAAKDVKNSIAEIGQQLVDRGFLDQATHDKYEGMYLPRVYLKHILGDDLFTALGSGKSPSDLGYLKQRKDIPEEVRRLILMEIKDPAYLAGRALSIPMRDIAIFNWFDQIADNKAWVWNQSYVTMSLTPEGQPEHLILAGGDGVSLSDPNKPVYGDFIPTKKGADGVFKPIDLKPQTITRKVTPFFLSQEAERMRKQAHAAPEADRADIMALADLYEQVANKAIEGMAGNATPKDFVQMPKSKRYGALAGLVVRKEIHSDIVGTMQIFQGDPSVAQKILGDGGALAQYTSLWKFMKVAANPPSHVRNIVSNLVMLHLSGVAFHQVPQRVFQAINEIKNGGKHWDIAKEYGVTQSTFANTELFRMNNELNSLVASNQDSASWDKLKAVIKLIAGKFVDKAGDLYQFMEGVGKTAKIIDEMEKGASAKDAALAAHDALFDYSLVSDNVRYLRNAPLGTPFATFYSKALPMLIKTAVTHPERFLPYVLTFQALGMLVAAQNDVDDDDLDKLKMSLQEWLREKGHAYFLPWKDDLGRWQAIDLGYFVPWTMFLELGKEAAHGDVMGAMRSLGVLGSPVADLVTALKTGQDSFTRKPIVNKFDTPAQQLGGILNYLWRMNMPTFLTDIGASGKLIEALSGDVDKYGEPKSTVGQALARFVGVNIYGIDPEHERAKNIRHKRFEMQEAKQEWRKAVKDLNASDKEKQKATEHYRELIGEMAQDLMQYVKDSEVHPNLKLKSN